MKRAQRLDSRAVPLVISFFNKGHNGILLDVSIREARYRAHLDSSNF